MYANGSFGFFGSFGFGGFTAKNDLALRGFDSLSIAAGEIGRPLS